MPVQQIKHNNNGMFYHIAIDIAKEGAQLFDLTPYVKGRVGDNNFGLLVDWYRQGMLMNVNGAYKPVIDGLVGNFSFDKNGNLKMDDDASPVYSEGKPEDCGPAGQVTYYFPEQMFPKEGVFKGYLGLIDDKGNRYSGVDIWFSVLAGNARMGIACDFYISELEKAIKEAEDDLLNSKKSMQKVVDEFVSKMNDLTNRLETQANTDQTALDALEQKIKQDGLFTEEEAKQLENRLALKLNTGFEHIYGTVDEMLSDQALGAGMYVRTAGYYTVNDGGGAGYLIASKEPLNYSEKLNNGLYAQLLYGSEPVNVLTFGVKNDGSQDISNIINEQTKLHALHLPAGKYLVNNQLDIYHNLSGETGPAGMSTDEKGLTTIQSGITGDNTKSVICNHGDSTIISKLNLHLNDNENGITDNGKYVTRLNDIYIDHVKNACGIKIDRPGSRASVINNVFVNGDAGNYASTGLYYLTGTDELLSNFWSMGCRVGIFAVVCLF